MSTSRYLDYLPAVFQEDTPAGEASWLERYLRGFEAILTGLGDPAEPGLEELLDGVPGVPSPAMAGIERLFEPGPLRDPPERAPDEFLPWLSEWVALSLRADIGTERQRVLIANAVRLYRMRGTKAGLEELVGIYTTPGTTTIDETIPHMQIGMHSTVGVDTSIDGGPPNYFRVTIRLKTTNPAERATQRRIVRAIVDAEKPAHTYYTLDDETPVLQIGVTSHIGLDTLLGGSG
jgi:phage tail-like protein